MNGTKRDHRKILLSVGDGPDSIEVYQDEDRSIVSECSPDSIYVSVTVMGALGIFGPMLPSVGQQLIEKLKPESHDLRLVR